MFRGLTFSLIFIACLGELAFAQTEPVKLAWIQIPNAVAYEIEVASSGSSGRPLVTRSVTIPEIKIELPPGNYVYRVRLTGGDGSKGPWSETQTFAVKPESIVLLVPSGERPEPGPNVRFSWKGATGYRYRIQILDSKGTVSELETIHTVYTWSPPAAGQYRWRISYAIAQPLWSEYKTVRVSSARAPSAAPSSAVKPEPPPKAWGKTLWAGVGMTSFSGNFADTGNSVTASTLSGMYAFTMERRQTKRFENSESRPSLSLGVQQKSLVKKTVWLPDLAVAYAYLWPTHRIKAGPMVDIRYRKTGLFTADAFKNYNYDSFWRGSIAAGPSAEFYVNSRTMLSTFAALGTASGGSPSLAPGGVKPSATFEAGLAARINSGTKWNLRLRFLKEDIKWSTPSGANKLASTDWAIDLGGEL